MHSPHPLHREGHQRSAPDHSRHQPIRRQVLSRRLLVIVLAAGVLLAADLSRAPETQATTRAVLYAIDIYQATLSPFYARAGIMCRFKPTCSHYGEAVIREFGVVRGGWMAVRRVLRCGPWTPMGTEDPPPVKVHS